MTGRTNRGHIATAPVLAYYGSKNRLAKRIVSTFLPHRVYVEPFFGSGAVLFAKRPSSTEVVNDIDSELVNFFKVVRDRPDELSDLLDFTPYARDELITVRTPKSGLDELERARRLFVSLNSGFSGVGGEKGDSGFSYSTGAHQSRADLFRNRTRRFRTVAYRLKDVEIENVDALTLLDRLDSPETTFYLDPPYLAETRVVAKRGYEHNSASPDFHMALLETCLKAEGQVVLSGYASDLYDTMLSGWQRREVAVKASAAGNNTPRTEVVWANRLPGRTIGP